MKGKSYKIYIIRLLKSLEPDFRLTKLTSEAIDSIIRLLSEKIVNNALLLTSHDEKKTISAREIQTSTHMIFNKDFAEKAIAFSQDCVSTFESAVAKPDKVQTREAKSGLIFSVSTAEKYIRKFGQVGFNVSSTTPVVLASILQYFTTYLLQNTISITRDNKKITLVIRHLFLATANDPNLSFINNLGIVFLEGGVKPQNIQKQHKKLKNNKFRWMPGSKTAMEINRLQKSGDMLLQHAPFNNLVRELIRSEKFRLTADFCKTLQAFAESQLIILMQRANKLASHSSRETVYSRDIELACSLFGEHLTEQDVKTNIPEASLRQLALRAGIQRYGDCSTNSYRNYLVYILKKYLQDIVLCAKHHKLQTLNTKLLLEGMSIHNIHPTIIHHKRKIAKTEQVNKEETTEVSEF